MMSLMSMTSRAPRGRAEEEETRIWTGINRALALNVSMSGECFHLKLWRVGSLLLPQAVEINLWRRAALFKMSN